MTNGKDQRKSTKGQEYNDQRKSYNDGQNTIKDRQYNDQRKSYKRTTIKDNTIQKDKSYKRTENTMTNGKVTKDTKGQTIQ